MLSKFSLTSSLLLSYKPMKNVTSALPRLMKWFYWCLGWQTSELLGSLQEYWWGITYGHMGVSKVAHPWEAHLSIVNHSWKLPPGSYLWTWRLIKGPLLSAVVCSLKPWGGSCDPFNFWEVPELFVHLVEHCKFHYVPRVDNRAREKKKKTQKVGPDMQQ